MSKIVTENLNISLITELKNLDTETLTSTIHQAQEILKQRHKKEAKEIIKRVVQDLERLRKMGNIVFTIDCESEYMHDIFDEITNFNDAFKIREV